MKREPTLIEPLLESAEVYGKTSLELLRLKSVEKIAETVAAGISRCLLLIPLVFLVFLATIGVCVWVGNQIGNSCAGFFVVAGGYGVVAVLLGWAHPAVKSRINDALIKQMSN